MLQRLLTVALLSNLAPAPPLSHAPFVAPSIVRFLVRDAFYNGRLMSSGLSYATCLPVVAHRSLALGTLVVLRSGSKSAGAIVLDNDLSSADPDLILSPVLVSRLGLLRDPVRQVTMEVTGHEPRNRWLHAIGALTPAP